MAANQNQATMQMRGAAMWWIPLMLFVLALVLAQASRMKTDAGPKGFTGGIIAYDPESDSYYAKEYPWKDRPFDGTFYYDELQKGVEVNWEWIYDPWYEIQGRPIPLMTHTYQIYGIVNIEYTRWLSRSEAEKWLPLIIEITKERIGIAVAEPTSMELGSWPNAHVYDMVNPHDQIVWLGWGAYACLVLSLITAAWIILRRVMYSWNREHPHSASCCSES